MCGLSCPCFKVASDTERAGLVFLMLVAGIVWAIVLGNVAGLFSVLLRSEMAFGEVLSCFSNRLPEGMGLGNNV